MAFDWKRAEIAGRLTKKPELKQTADGTFVCPFTIAVNEKRNGESVPEFCECVAFGKTAEAIAQYFDKGKAIFVSCDKGWRTRKWKGKDGNDNFKTEFVVSEFRFVDAKSAEDTQTPTADAQQPAGEEYAGRAAVCAPRFEDVADDLPLPF